MMRLTFVESDEHYSIYREPDGTLVNLAHGPGFRRLVDLDTLDLIDEWGEFCRTFGAYVDEFLESLRNRVTTPDYVDEIVWCAHCSDPAHTDENFFSTYDGSVCESCLDEYWTCHDCEERFRSTTTTLNDTEVCENCRNRNWTYCDHCEGWRHDDDYEHDHDEGDGSCDGCVSPALHFTIRNDGEPALAEDTRVTVTLPAGTISAVGMNEIASYLRNKSYELDDGEAARSLRRVGVRLAEIGDKWQTKDGNFTKRLSRFAFQQYQFKVSKEILSQVGCIARDHSTAVDFELEVTRDLNLSASAFYHGGSCWWASESPSRCALKNNGGFALRTFSGSDVTGRVWVMPLKLNDGALVPTFETQEPAAFVVFNGYGTLSGYTPARIMSHMAGWTYRRIDFSCGPMYINNGGYLIAPEDIATNYTDGSLYLSADAHSSLFHSETTKVLTDAA